MKPDRKIFIITYIGFGIFLLFLCVGTYLDNSIEIFPRRSLTDNLFDSCVTVLSFTSDLFDIDFRTINVIIFCVLMPIGFISMFVYNFILRSRLDNLTSDIHAQNRATLLNGSNSFVNTIRDT